MRNAAWLAGLLVLGSGCGGSVALVGGDAPSQGGQGGVSAQAGSTGSNVAGSSASNVAGSSASNVAGSSASNVAGSSASNVAGSSAASNLGGATGAGEGGDVGSVEVGVGGDQTMPPGPLLACSVTTIDAWIAFDSDHVDFNRDLYLIRPDGSALTRLTTDASVEKEPAFSPDGKSLSFTSDRGGTLQIYIMTLSNRSVRQLTNRAEGADESSFSPDSSLVTFHSGGSVYTIGADGKNELVGPAGLVNSGTAYQHPRFIDNTQLVFDRYNEIDASNLDSSDFHNIVGNTTTTITAPSVSPQGDEVAYATWCPTDKALSIWTTSATTSTPTCGGRRVTPAGDALTNTHPAWGPQDELAYERVDDATNIGVITITARARGSVTCPLSDPNDSSHNPSWSPVGLKL
jgi:Tol biopolymer transport system component